MTKLTDPWSPTPPIICDFSWYAPGGGLFPTQTYRINGIQYPPADRTWTSGGVTYSTQYSTYTTVSVSSASPTTGKNGGVITTDSVAPCLFVVPLNQSVVFDAVDSDSLGLPKVLIDPNTLVHIVSYSWNLGNGVLSSGPTVTTVYTYPQIPPDLAVTLTIVDTLGRTYSTTKQITIEIVELSGGAANRVRQGTSRTFI
jgi:hypothetical protein